MLIRVAPDWELPDREATAESIYWNRRKFVKRVGLAGMGLLLGDGLLQADDKKNNTKAAGPAGEGAESKLYPASRNESYTLDRPVTSESWATGYNNFYEFSFQKDQVKEMVEKFKIEPWKVEISGLVKKPRTLDLDDILKMCPLQERLYRFRCVEAWAMAVPWTGFPFKTLIGKLEPLGAAKYVRMVTFLRPDEAPNQKYPGYPWPYYEGLRLDEATNELTMLATGIYGKPLPKQNGAPIRLIVPWKYGFKSIKSIVKIEFTEKQPTTFWNTVAPKEYGFLANVNPRVPHPRWSQARERMIGTDDGNGLEIVRPTQLYNGYEKQVGKLYD